jgi:DNA mismatch endonuclease (patch repair protein)
MADTFSKLQRSQIMRAVKSEGTGAEKKCEALLRALGIRFRRHAENFPGKPDFLCRDSNVAIFVHGCFWHGHKGCKRADLPASNRKYWNGKIAANRRRDAKVRRELRRRGYRTIIIWECRLRNSGSVSRRLFRLAGSSAVGKKLG